MGTTTVYERHVLGNHSDHAGLFPASETGQTMMGLSAL
jgi:hypothetical protein